MRLTPSPSRDALASFVVLATLVGATVVRAEEPKEWTTKNVENLVTLYKEFHAAPELSFQETQTAARVAAELKKLGAEVTTGVGKMGVVGLMRNGAGPTVMIRTDLDALPVIEATQLPYASKVIVKDSAGREVARQSLGSLPPGRQTLDLPEGLAAGKYQVSIEVKNASGAAFGESLIEAPR